MHNYAPVFEDQTTEKILNVATEMFVAQGLRITEMKVVAEKAGVNRRMLYRRFESKDALAFYAMIKIIKTIQAATITADGRGSILDLVVLQGTNGYEKLKYGLHGFIDQLLKFSAQVKFFAEFDSFYGDIYPDIQAADEYKDFIDLAEAVSWFSLADLIREGLQDGSIQTDLEPDYLAFCLVNAILSLLTRNILLAARLDKNTAVSRRSIYDSVDLMLAGIKA